jgi:acetoin utilization protein AcuC
MADDACLVFEPDLVAYDFGSGHPMSPVRVDLTVRLAPGLGVVGESGLPVIAAPHVDPDLLARVHTPDYIAAVEAISDSYDQNLRYGLGTPDCPSFAGIHGHRHTSSVRVSRRRGRCER